jgi:hypothetical protein
MTHAPRGEILPPVAAAILVLVLVGRWNYGAYVALLVLVVLNGIPGPDLEELAVPGSFRISDVAVFLLVAVAALRRQPASVPAGALLRFARLWGVALATWWFVVLVRSFADGIPLLSAALYGRDFLYFAILLPLLAGAFRDRREIAACLAVLAAAGVLHAVGQLAITVGGATSLVDLLVHTQVPVGFERTPRIVSYMDAVTTMAVPFAIGLALIPPRRHLRLVGIALATVFALSVLFQFTRATYLALTFALIVVSASWIFTSGAISGPLRRTTAALATVAVVGLFAAGFRPLTSPVDLPSEAAAVSERAASGVEDLRRGTGTVRYRYELRDDMLDVLGDRWPIGLGFWHPEVRPVSSLPEGSIRNADVGVLNAVMTMGVIGAALVYLPLVKVFVATMRRRRDIGSAARLDQWFFFGAATWIVYAVASSVSLMVLFSVFGLVLTATLLACGICLIDWKGSENDSRVSSQRL